MGVSIVIMEKPPLIDIYFFMESPHFLMDDDWGRPLMSSINSSVSVSNSTGSPRPKPHPGSRWSHTTWQTTKHNWLVGQGNPTPLKNMSSSIGMMRFPILMGK